MEGNEIAVKKSPVEIRREIMAVPGVMEGLAPIERAVYMASTARTIAEYSSKELAAELANALRWIAKDVGYRSEDETERQYLVIRVAEILKRYYGQLSLKDFRMAFEMCVTGELDEYLPRGRDGQPDRGHYQQFNAEYVCKVMNAYKARRGWVLKKAFDSVPKKKEAEPSHDMGEVRRWLLDAYVKYRESGVFPKLSPIAEMLLYNQLVEIGFAEEIKIADEDCESVLRRAIAWHLARGNFGAAKRLKEAGTSDAGVRYDAYVGIRGRRLREAFAGMAANNVDLTEYIKFE